MAIEKREQVFISSTFKDLVEERRAVLQTLLEADCIPAGMELFPASDDEKFDLIKGVIDLCDYYVVIVGGRYGSVDAERQISYTEMEFDYAVSQRKPVMGFLHGNPGSLVSDKTDLDPALRSKLNEFRAKIENKMVKYWLEPKDLPAQVALAIMQIRKSHPAEGWIRASEAMTPEIKAELVELRAKVRELSADLKDEQRQHRESIDPSELGQGDDEIEIKCRLRIHWKSVMDSGEAYSHNREWATWTVPITWNRIFKHFAPVLLDEATEQEISSSLSRLCVIIGKEELLKYQEEDFEVEEDDEESRVGAIYDGFISTESFNDIKVQFLALKLIEGGAKRRTNSDTNTYWKLTDQGTSQLVRLRATRRSAPILVENEDELATFNGFAADKSSNA